MSSGNPSSGSRPSRRRAGRLGLLAATGALLAPLSWAVTPSGPAGAVTTGVTLGATVPNKPLVSGIAGVGYYSASSTISAKNNDASPSAVTTFTVVLPFDLHTAQFSVTSTITGTDCPVVVAATTRTFTCPIPALAAGKHATVATILGWEDYLTGLPASVKATLTAPNGTVTTRSWKWVLPYSHLVAQWSGLPTSVDYGAPTPATLTITNDGIWPTAYPTVITILAAPVEAFNTGWSAYSGAIGSNYCGYSVGPTANLQGFSCTLGAIPNGTTVTITVSARPTDPLGRPVALEAVLPDGTTVTSPTVDVVGTGADLTLTTANPDRVLSGGLFTRTYTVTNTGSTEAVNVTLFEHGGFPVASSSGDGSCTYYPGGYRVGSRLGCSFSTVPAHGSVTITTVLRAPSISGVGTTVTQAAFLSTSSYLVAGDYTAATTAITVDNTVPAVVVAPTLTGTPQVGQTLTVDWGTWSGSGTLSLWAKLCRTTNIGCAGDIATSYHTTSTTEGATPPAGFTYVVQPADVGSHIVLVVVAQNLSGSMVTFTSDPTAVVTP